MERKEQKGGKGGRSKGGFSEQSEQANLLGSDQQPGQQVAGQQQPQQQRPTPQQYERTHPQRQQRPPFRQYERPPAQQQQRPFQQYEMPPAQQQHRPPYQQQQRPPFKQYERPPAQQQQRTFQQYERPPSQQQQRPPPQQYERLPRHLQHGSSFRYESPFPQEQQMSSQQQHMPFPRQQQRPPSLQQQQRSHYQQQRQPCQQKRQQRPPFPQWQQRTPMQQQQQVLPFEEHQKPSGFSQQPQYQQLPPIPQQPIAFQQQSQPRQVCSVGRETEHPPQPLPTQEDQQLTHEKSAQAPLTEKSTGARKRLQKEIEQSIKEKAGGDFVKKEEKYELVLDRKAIRSSGGKSGRVIKIETNHFAITLGKLTRAAHYNVAISPDKPKIELRRVMEAFREKYYPNRYPAFDGVKNIYASSELPFDNEISGEVNINIDDRPREYKVKVKFANYVDFSSLREFFSAQSNRRHMLPPQDAIQCIDVVLRMAPSLQFINVGRSFFTPPGSRIVELGEGMEMYYGFYQSAICAWKPFLNVDVTHKAFPISQNIIDLIKDLFGRDLIQNQLRFCPLHDIQKETVEKYIRTLKVEYEIPKAPSSRKIYRVNGITESADSAQFTDATGTSMTVADYFRLKKNYNLQYPKLQCLWVGSLEKKPRILLPPELCRIMPGQAVRRKISETQTSNLIRKTATDTQTRKKKIMSYIKDAQYNIQPEVREFGFSVASKLEKVDARILDPPKLLYAGRKEITPSRGVWKTERTQLLTAARLRKWTIANWDRRTSPDKLDQLADMICSRAKEMGMRLHKPQRPFQMLQTRKGRDLEDIKNFFESKKDYELIIVVIPDSPTQNYYSYVKQAAEVAVGCLTQCIRSRTVSKLDVSCARNIILKINAKLNGINHSFADVPSCLKVACMIMGADVTHPQPDSEITPSFAAVTASHEPLAFKYNICWRLQPPKTEIIKDLEEIVKEHLMFFYRHNNGQKPSRIIFFRDGVSEGQFLEVLNCELTAIRRACTSMNPEYKPAITFLVVQKRHHTRLFPCNLEDSEDNNMNVPAGTCVDTVITHPTAQEFYLVSHANIKGVARPTKYRTLWDDQNTSDDEIEQLTYYLCHMFTRCNRSVSYPAPTYYAHLAATRAKVYTNNISLDINNLSEEQSHLEINNDIRKDRPMFFV